MKYLEKGVEAENPSKDVLDKAKAQSNLSLPRSSGLM
jgi:hypothetical protein